MVCDEGSSPTHASLSVNLDELPDQEHKRGTGVYSSEKESSSHDDIEITSTGLPSLEFQRDFVVKAMKASLIEAREGDKTYIIPQLWYQKFLDTNVTSAEDLGPIDTSIICRDYENFILVDYDQCPYLSIPESVFDQLVEWYGLAPGSEPVTTFLIRDEATNTLVTEYNRCILRAHHLAANSRGRRLTNVRPLYFSVSRFSTIKEVYTKILSAFLQRESLLDADEAMIKVWYVKDSEINEQRSILQSSYRLNPFQFMKLPVKTRITPQNYSHTLQELEIFSGDFVIEIKQTGRNHHWLSNFFIYNEMVPSKGTTGLTNLGNTCYMNSALQCLVHIPELRDYFLYNGYESEINVDNPLGHQGHIAKAFCSLVQNLFDNRAISSSSEAFSPGNFKNIIGHFNGMFSGYMQQDSQEFLAFLLDGIHEDLNRIFDKPYIEKPSLSRGSDLGDDTVIKKLAEDTWKMHLLRNDSVITDLFVGLYESTLKCPACSNVSITFDPYNDLTLPLPVNSTWHAKVKIFPQNSPPCILEVELNKSASYQELKDYVAEYAGLESRNLYGCEIFNHQICTNYESSEAMSQFLSVHELISDTDDVIFYELVVSKDDIIVPVLSTKIEEGFNTARPFGVPLFLVLSLEERKNPGLIRLKLEKCYSSLSGGFVEFPLSLIDEPCSIDSLPLLREKYKLTDFSEYQSMIKYAVPENVDINEFFRIKVLDRSNVRLNPRESSSHENHNVLPSFWAPTTRLDINRSRDMTELLDHPIRDIYDYATFVHTHERENTSSPEPNCGLDRKQDSQENMEELDSDLDDDPSKEHVNHKSAYMKNENDEVHHPGKNIIQTGDLIICEWSSPAIEEVFSADKQISWERPAELVNNEIEERRRKEASGEAKKTITLHDCLRLFSKPEVLSLNDSWYCPTCKEHRQATKQIQLWSTPDILLIHLKRFENQRSFSDKIDKTVHFPITGLDMEEHLVNKDPRGSVYDLVAVDNHYGGLGGGHYTAYVKNVDKWYYFDDSRVTETEPERSIAGSAYLLFYSRRTESGKIGGSKLQEILAKSRREYDLEIQRMLEQQKMVYTTNRSDEEDSTEDDDEPEDQSDDKSEACMTYALNTATLSHASAGSIENLVTSRSADYSIASLEVGLEHKEPVDEAENNLGRRKLRLLNKTYTEPSTDTSPASSVSSDGADSISAVLNGSKINDGSLPNSPAKE